MSKLLRRVGVISGLVLFHLSFEKTITFLELRFWRKKCWIVVDLFHLYFTHDKKHQQKWFRKLIKKKNPNILIALFYIFLHIVWREPDGTIVGSSNTYKYSMWIPRVCVCMRRVRRKPNAICLSLSGAILRVNSLYYILKYELSLGKYTWWPKSKSVMFLRKLCYLVSL